MMAKTYTLFDFLREYPSDDACLDKIMALRYGDNPICAACERDTVYYKLTKRRAYSCKWCGTHVYPCVGTPFEKSRTSLTKWFYAMYLFTTSRHGVPAKELERQLGVTYKTAWRIAHIIRQHMATFDTGMLFGEVEIDEAYIGGKHSGTTGRGANGKTFLLCASATVG